MADDFAQVVKGIIEDGATIVSTDGLLPVAAKKGSIWTPLVINDTSGGLEVEVVKLTSTPDIAKTTIYGSEDGDTTQVVIKTQADGKLDIRDLTHDRDQVKIGNGTNTLLVNSDGSINVNTSGGLNTLFDYGAVNLVKDTPTTVVSRTPSGADEKMKYITVSGAGLCFWEILFGTTSSEVVKMGVWTTPSNPTQQIDLPDSLILSSSETIIVQATNKENAASPSSDFIGSATIIRGE